MKNLTKESTISEDIAHNQFIKIQAKKTGMKVALQDGPKFTSTAKGSVLNSKCDILNLIRWLQLEKILHEIGNNDERIVHNTSNKQFKTKDVELELIVREIKK